MSNKKTRNSLIEENSKESQEDDYIINYKTTSQDSSIQSPKDNALGTSDEDFSHKDFIKTDQVTPYDAPRGVG